MIFNYTVQWHKVHSHCAAITHPFLKLVHCPKLKLLPINSNLPISSRFLWPLLTTTLLSDSMNWTTLGTHVSGII